MKTQLLELLIKQKESLTQTSERAQNILKNKIDGSLDIIKQGNLYRYYLISSKETEEKDSKKKCSKKKYIPVNKTNIAKQIVARDYAKKILPLATKELKLCNQLIQIYNKTNSHNCYDSMHSGRKCLVEPLLYSDEEYKKRWMAVKSNNTNTIEHSSAFYTENKEEVRSKSEKIIADKLSLHNIPYKYEFALKLKDKTIFPDFTILNLKTRTTMYWEHFGMIDNPEYLAKCLEKLSLYSHNDIIVGKNLICTFESSQVPIDTMQINKIIKNIFL